MPARRRVLVVTNDFPPRLGGIQSFVFDALSGLDPAEIAVYTSSYPGAEEFDARLPYRVWRDRSTMLLPTPRVRAAVLAARREHGATAVWFGAAAPLGLLAAALRADGAQRLVATTHGHEAGWAQLPVARRVLRRIGDDVDVVTYLGAYTEARLRRAMRSSVTLRQLAPGVDTERFTPDVDGSAVRARHGLGDAPTVACVSRLVARKGQDTLVEAWPAVLAAVPAARLLLVGRGPYRTRLERLAQRLGIEASVVFTGAVAADELPAHIAAGDVFAMPCRTRRRGLDVEGLGIVYLEAGACARPVIAGDSGGAPDAVLAGKTGQIVDGRDRAAVAAAVIALLTAPERRAAMGAAGRAWVEQNWQWSQVSARLDALLQS